MVFWGPLSWTMIFGLLFATALTLLLIPSMYLIVERLKRKSEKLLAFYNLPRILLYLPFFILLLQAWTRIKSKTLDFGDLDA